MAITPPRDLYGIIAIPNAVSIQSFLWTTPTGFFPTNFNQNIYYRDAGASALGSQHKQVAFRGINVSGDFTGDANNRIITIVNNNGDTQEVIANTPGWQPVYGWGIISIGTDLNVDSLQVGI